VLASSLGFMAASAFVSDERVLNVGIGVAQLRLANLVQGDWRSGASQVAYQGGIDHLMRAGPFDDLPGTSRLVGFSSWIRCTGTAPIKTPKASGNSRFPARPDLVLKVHGMLGEIRQASRKVLAKEIRRVAAARVASGPGQTAGSGGRTGSLSSPAWRLAEPGEVVGETRPGPGAATGRSQVPAARRRLFGTRGLDLAGHPVMKAGGPST
jgi:hypothetical protein